MYLIVRFVTFHDTFTFQEFIKLHTTGGLMSDLYLGVGWTTTEQVCIPDKGVLFPLFIEIRTDVRRSLCKNKQEDQEFEVEHRQGKLHYSLKPRLHRPQSLIF